MVSGSGPKATFAGNQATLAAAFFAAGAVLLAISRGVATGAGGIGLYLDVEFAANNFSQSVSSFMSDELVHKRWDQRRAAQPW